MTNEMKSILAAACYLLISCNSKPPVNASKGVDTTNRNASALNNHKREDSSFLITAYSIGGLHIGDRFDKAEQVYNNCRTIKMRSEVSSWPAKKVTLDSGEWILIESTSGNGTIDRISTNCKKFKTVRGFYVGQNLWQVLNATENAGVDLDEGFLSARLYSDEISARVDDKSERLFYKKKGMELKDIRPDATIVGFCIY